MVYDHKEHNLYMEDVGRCKEIGKLLADRFLLRGFSRDDLVKIYSQDSGLATSTSTDRVKELLRGGPNAIQLSTHSRNPWVLKRRPIEFLRLARFYEGMGIEPNDEIITRTKEINPSFEYPPGNVERDLPKDFPGSIRDQLTEIQVRSLEGLASSYLKRNEANGKD